MITMKKVFPDRTDLLSKLAENPDFQWDVIVIGGGIVGAGVLQEATRRGLKALLIEQKDFAWGTSSRSSKMIHGGLRYIAQGDIKLTKDSLQERERLLKEAPGLITRMGYHFVIRKRQFPGRFIMSTLLSIYDWLANINDHRFDNSKTTLKHFPNLEPNNLIGANYYTDSVVDDARLVMRVLQESIQAGGQALNYVKATELVKNTENGQVIGVKITDNDNQQSKSFTLKSAIVINATGAWSDKLRNEVINEQRIRPLRGSHLIVPQEKLTLDAALTVLHPSDKRPVFIFPWEGATVIGTTDLDHQEKLDHEACISQAEVDYLLQIVTTNFPKSNITSEDIISTFSGVRPVISSDKEYHARMVGKQHARQNKSPSKERRDHAIWADKGLITASGGKLTTFRLTAIEALDAAKPWLKNKPMRRNATPIFEKIDLSKAEEVNRCSNQVNNSQLQRLYGRYGNNAKLILIDASKAELALITSTQFCLAECRWAIKNETIMHLDDLLLRRTRLGLLINNGAQTLFPKLEIIFQQELGWDKVKWQDEIKRYKSIWQKFYYLPT